MKKTVLALALLAASAAQGGTYKCTNAQGAVEFSDKPCIGASVEEMRIRDNQISGPAARSGSPHSDQLTALVMRAVANKDYRKARELAVTERHWALIAEAERYDTQSRVDAAKARAARRPVVCNTTGSSDAINTGSHTFGSYRGTTYCY